MYRKYIFYYFSILQYNYSYAFSCNEWTFVYKSMLQEIFKSIKISNIPIKFKSREIATDKKLCFFARTSIGEISISAIHIKDLLESRGKSVASSS